MTPEVQPVFTQNNLLRIEISNHNLKHGEFKFCFSLVYSIISIDGAEIIKQIGRYYEIKTHQNIIFLTLQSSRIKSYNMSCGPEGVFIITKNEELLELNLKFLKFEKEINSPLYDFKTSDNFNPIIPEPEVANFKNKFINLNNLKIKINSEDDKFFKVFLPYASAISLDFNSLEGFPLIQGSGSDPLN